MNTVGSHLCGARLDLKWLQDIGHVDFLEMVYKQVEKPYVIVGLHFDQVHLITDTHTSAKFPLKDDDLILPCCVSSSQETFRTS